MASALSHIVYSVQSYTQYDLVRKPSTLDALIGYCIPSHVIHQRLLLRVLSAPEDGRKKRPKHLEHYAVTNKLTAKLHHLILYIYYIDLYLQF